LLGTKVLNLIKTTQLHLNQQANRLSRQIFFPEKPLGDPSDDTSLSAARRIQLFYFEMDFFDVGLYRRFSVSVIRRMKCQVFSNPTL